MPQKLHLKTNAVKGSGTGARNGASHAKPLVLSVGEDRAGAAGG
jgi:hypothetical protein